MELKIDRKELAHLTKRLEELSLRLRNPRKIREKARRAFSDEVYFAAEFLRKILDATGKSGG